MARLLGGSKAEHVNNNSTTDNSQFGSYFHPNVRAIDLSASMKGRFRILPAFSRAVAPEDKLFKISFDEYRSRDTDLYPEDADTSTPGFTDWFVPIRAYKFFGNAKIKFVSPQTIKPGKAAGVDPIRDCVYLCLNKIREGEKEYAQYFDYKVNPDAYLKQASDVILVNALYENPENESTDTLILAMTKMGFIDLKKALSETAGRNDPVISKNWDEFRFGDVTSPTDGCWLNVVEVKTVSGNNPGGLYPATKPGSFTGYAPHKFDPESAEGMKILKSRYDIADTDNVTKIWTYQEIVDFLVQDQGVPYELITEACSKYCDIPAKPASSPASSKKTSVATVKENVTSTPPARSAFPGVRVKESEVNEEDDIPMTFSEKETATEQSSSSAPWEDFGCSSIKEMHKKMLQLKEKFAVDDISEDEFAVFTNLNKYFNINPYKG